MESLAPHISCYAVVDTGSDDNTVELIQKFMAEKNIPGVISKVPFKDFSQARNAALELARTSNLEYDYIILCDADMQLRVNDFTWADNLNGPSYDMYQTAGSIHYQNRRLVAKSATGVYLGVTHEYLNVDTAGCIPENKADFYDHADGANRPEKFKRDIKLLKKAIEDEPRNERYMYYLAQSYRDAGKLDKAAKWYKRRVEAGGWDEEVWSAMHQRALCLLAENDEAGFVKGMTDAYAFRPSRVEPLYDLAKFYRLKGKNAASLIFSDFGRQVPKTNDALFVDNYVYESGCKDEFSICAFYIPAKRFEGFKVTNELALQKTQWQFSREMAKSNLFHYMPKLKEFCPSFTDKRLDFKSEQGWTAMNPSIVCDWETLRMVVRTVNYRMDDQGRYLINGPTNSEPNNTNPINTRNFLVKLNEKLDIEGTPQEILPPGNWPKPVFLPVIGFEDMRLFYKGTGNNTKLYISACVREANAEGYCEQFVARIDTKTKLCDWKKIPKEPRLYEKNWMPIETNNDKMLWMYRIGEVIDKDGNTVVKHDVPWDVGAISGGSQVIQGKEYPYICLVHEARFLPGTQKRYYWHRFVGYDKDFKPTAISWPFVFNDKVIEFAAGLCRNPYDLSKLIISYGYKDEEARLATIALEEVEKLLCQSVK